MPNDTDAIDVTSDPSPDSQNDQDDVAAVADAPPVSGVADSDLPDDRPWKNYKAEMDRKYTELRGALGELVNVLTAMQQTRTEPVRPAEAAHDVDASLEELAKRAAMGDPTAQIALVESVAARTNAKAAVAVREQQFVSTSLSALYGKYPVLSDATHPLTRAAMRAKAVLLATGRYVATDPATDLESIKLAIIDNPDLAAQSAVRPAASAVDASRRAAVAAASNLDGATTRRLVVKTRDVPVTAEEMAIARRMGIKDVNKAKRNFEKRQAEGRSALSPTVLQVVREQS